VTNHTVQKRTVKLPWVMVFSIARFYWTWKVDAKDDKKLKMVAHKRKTELRYPKYWKGQNEFDDNPRQMTSYKLMGVVANRSRKLEGS